MMRADLLLVVAAVLGVVHGRSVVEDEVRLDTPPSNFIGEGTNELATALLQGFVGEERDFVFSPFGYSVILAIMAEGARGGTRNQLVSALHLPEDTYAVRQNYKSILEPMKDRWSINKPEFKNWFYVYKNYSIEDAYKKVLLDNYYTEVKHVQKVHYQLDFDSEESEKDKKVKEERKELEIDHPKTDKVLQGVKEEKKDTDKTTIIEVPKSDEVIKQDETEVENTDSELQLPSSFNEKGFDGLTANEIQDRNSQGTELNPETKMIVFNGFYFRGSWKTPFVLTKEDEEQSFYKTPSDKRKITMMKTTGSFDIGAVPELDAVALELPYEGDQYSMLVLLPNERDGLNKLTADIAGFSLNRVYKYLVNRPVEVLLPKYQITTISHPQQILKKYGVSDVFSSESDLSGISTEKLKMGDLVQIVNIHIDEGSADANFLTTTTVGALRNNAEKFVGDHPFLFFIRDQPKNVVVAAGKVIDPKFDTSDDLP